MLFMQALCEKSTNRVKLEGGTLGKNSKEMREALRLNPYVIYANMLNSCK